MDTSTLFSNFVLIIGMLIVVLGTTLFAAYRKKKEHVFMQHIAQTLGFTYEERGDAASTHAANLAGGQIYDVISGVHNSISIGAFTYRILVGGRQKYWSYMTVFETPLPVTLPDIVLAPTNFNDMDMAAHQAVSRTTLLSNYEKLPLEGNFDKYFTLYITKGAHIEALELFTPDVMADLIDQYSSCGLEFNKETLYLYPMKLITDDATFMQTLSLLEKLITNVSSTLQNMSASAPTNTQATPTPAPAAASGSQPQAAVDPA